MLRNEAMVLPQNAMPMEQEEMRYVEGGATWSKVVTVKNKKYRVTITNIRQAAVNLLLLAAGVAAVVSGLMGVKSGILTGNGAMAVASAAVTFCGVATIGHSVAQLKKYVKVKRA